MIRYAPHLFNNATLEIFSVTQEELENSDTKSTYKPTVRLSLGNIEIKNGKFKTLKSIKGKGLITCTAKSFWVKSRNGQVLITGTVGLDWDKDLKCYPEFSKGCTFHLDEFVLTAGYK